MTDLTEAYAALQKADAAGDTAGARQLADYIRSQSDRKVQSYDAVNGQLVPTGSSAAVAARSPVADTNFGQNALIGAGKFFTDMGLGARQIYGQVADAISPQDKNLSGLITGQQPTRTATLQQEAVDKRAIDAPVMGTWGGKAGQIGAGVISAIPLSAVPGANTYAGAATIGGGFGALTPTTQKDSRLLNTGVGAGLGIAGKYAGDSFGRWLSQRAQQSSANAAGSAAGSASAQATPGVAGAQASATATPTVNIRNTPSAGYVGDEPSVGLTQSQQEAIQNAQGLGFRLSPGQATGSKALQQVEAKLSAQPMTSGTFTAIDRNNARALARTFLGAIGESGDEVSPSILQRADSRIGSVFENAAQNNNINWDPILEHNLSNIEQTASSELSSSEMGIIRKQMGNLLDKAADNNSQISGQAYQNARQGLSRLSGNSSTAVGYWARQVRDALDEALTRSVPPEDAAALVQARDQYRILSTALNRTGAVNVGTGNLSPGTLANAFAQSDKRGFLYGENQSPLYNALRFSQAFKPIVGDSGTATRSPLNLSEMALSIPIRVATGAYASSPGVRLATGATAAARAAGNAGSWLGSVPGVQATLPYVQAGLPGLGGTSVPYLMQ